MNVREAYGQWSSQYDTNVNLTRDMEAVALRRTLEKISFDSCLEIGCGTGKNTVWLAEHAAEVCAVDLTPEMLDVAAQKVHAENVTFISADITLPWSFRKKTYGLVSFSLVLEHVKDLDLIFREAAASLDPGRFMYIGELHPFKQYSGSKARFETEEGTQTVECYDHHVSDFLNLSNQNGFELCFFEECFDDNKEQIPRLLVLLFRKRQAVL